MLYRNVAKAIATTLALVVFVLGLVFLIAVVIELTDHFTIDRFLGIVGALSGIGWLVSAIVSAEKLAPKHRLNAARLPHT